MENTFEKTAPFTAAPDIIIFGRGSGSVHKQ